MKLQTLIQNLENRVASLIAQAKSGVKGLRNVIVEIMLRISKLEKKLNLLNQQKEEKPMMTLRELGKWIENLSEEGDYEDWDFTMWTKNGELRIYAKDVSYRNPKDRGYYIIDEDGDVTEYPYRKNNPLPNLPELPAKLFENDLLQKTVLSKEEKIERYLDSQYGRGGWDSRDFIDAEEMECFQ
jgi:hypothetical protein